MNSTPTYTNRVEVERVGNIKFQQVTITSNLPWNSHIDAMVKEAQQCLFFLRWLRKFGMSTRTPIDFCSYTIESILFGRITTWYGKCSAQDRKKLQKVVCTAQTIME
eukprot:g22943.t1